jgi:hypothetical protein
MTETKIMTSLRHHSDNYNYRSQIIRTGLYISSWWQNYLARCWLNTTQLTLILRCLLSSMQICDVCSASSRVGTMIMAKNKLTKTTEEYRKFNYLEPPSCRHRSFPGMECCMRPFCRYRSLLVPKYLDLKQICIVETEEQTMQLTG